MRFNDLGAPQPILARCSHESFVCLAHSLPPKDSRGISVSQETDTEPESLGKDGPFMLDVGAPSPSPGPPEVTQTCWAHSRLPARLWLWGRA